MSVFSDVCIMLNARQLQYRDVSSMKIVELEYHWKIMADDLFSSTFD